MKKIIIVLMSLLMLTTVFAGCAKKETLPAMASGDSKKELKVGFIYVGPPGDGGYTYQHDQGRKYLEEQLKVKTITKENVKEDKAEVKKVIDGMVDEGANVIFATSFGFMDGVEEAAKTYPNVKFLHASGYKSNTKNFLNYFGRIEEPRYLSGIVAGLKTKSDKIGYVAAFEIPECIRGINAFALGVQAVNPDAKVIVKWTHTWYDPAIEKQAAKALLDEGADVLTQHQDSPAVQQAAEEKSAFSIGYNSDMKDKAPKAYMTSPVWNWGPYYVDQVKAIQNGSWKVENYWGNMKDGVVDLAPLTANAPADAKDKVEKAKADILSGKLNVFAGPIKDQSGKERIAAGKVMTDEEQLSIDWFVQGVEGNPKAN
jgi:basic membrane protein A